MSQWWAGNEQAERMVKPDPARFGLDLEAVRARFTDYLHHMDRWAA
ncbi:hypothetical protein [Novosphingobium panipatense]